MIHPQHITEYYINSFIPKGATVIDATAGNGNDTLKLCSAVGPSGKVFAFDIQKKAIDNTNKLLKSYEFHNAELVLASHSLIDKYVKTQIDAAVFNLGYLPGGDHNIQTTAQTTIEAIEKCLALLSDSGFISVTVYYGKNSGTEEKEGVMEYLSNLDHKKYTVLTHDFLNRPNNPPITVIITKNAGSFSN